MSDPISQCQLMNLHVVNLAQWPVLVWYCYVGDILEEILFCESLEGRTTGEDIFRLINKFFEMNGLLWSNYVVIFSDSAAALIGTKKRVYR
jgi:hypothetical protein